MASEHGSLNDVVRAHARDQHAHSPTLSSSLAAHFYTLSCRHRFSSPVQANPESVTIMPMSCVSLPADTVGWTSTRIRHIVLRYCVCEGNILRFRVERHVWGCILYAPARATRTSKRNDLFLRLSVCRAVLLCVNLLYVRFGHVNPFGRKIA